MHCPVPNKQRVDNLVVANLRSYPKSCTAASCDISVKYFHGHGTRLDAPCCRHDISARKKLYVCKRLVFSCSFVLSCLKQNSFMYCVGIELPTLRLLFGVLTD